MFNSGFLVVLPSNKSIGLDACLQPCLLSFRLFDFMMCSVKIVCVSQNQPPPVAFGGITVLHCILSQAPLGWRNSQKKKQTNN